MKTTGDQNLIKKINKSLVLDTIMAKAPLSRADISVQTGLNKTTVSSLVNEWLEEQLVIETGLGHSSGGRKPVMLLFNRSAGFAVGVDVGVNYIAALLTDLSGTIIAKRRHPLDLSEPCAVAERIQQEVRALIAQTPSAPYGIVGVGIGVPGIVGEDGVVLTAPNLGWHEVPLGRLLQSELGMPVVIDNEANAGALGEKQYGIGKDARNLVYVSAGIGIGTGIIIHNEVYRGASGLSGELGHMTIQSVDGLPCSCGSSGCWEMYASEKSLLRLFGRSHERGQLEDCIRLATDGDSDAIHALEEIGHYLGVGVGAIINGLNPELVIIGNRLAQARSWMEESILEAARCKSLRYHQERARIEFASLGLDSAPLGAASMAISDFFQRIKSFTP